MRPAPASPPAAPPEKLFSASFVLACLGSLAAFLSFYFLLGTLPVFAQRVGGSSSAVGLIIGVFSATAVVSRLPVGRFADVYGRKGFLVAGALLLFVSCLLYAWVRGTTGLLGLRVLHGVGWAVFGTALNALVADVVPARRRGEAMGYFGMASNAAMAAGPALGVAVMNRFDFRPLFFGSAAVALLALVAVAAVREPPRPPREAGFLWADLVEPSSLFPGLVLSLVALTYGTIVTFVPLYAPRHAIANPGLFFTVYAVVLVAARSVTGRISDRRGRAAVIVPGLLCAAAALGVLALTGTVAGLLLAAVLYALGFAAVHPALMAMVVDRAPARRRGAAMGSFAVAMDLGIGAGAIFGGLVAERAGFAAMYLAAAGVALGALAVFLLGHRRVAAVHGPPRLQG